MNKKDFWTLMFCDAVAVVLLIQHFCDLPIALEVLCIWSIISLLVHIVTFRNYVKVSVFI